MSIEQKNYYALLGVAEDASTHQIKEAFRKLALRYHPDRNQGNPEAQSKMQQINEAYAVLSDPEKRRQYDSMYRRLGDAAQTRFRQSYSTQDLFSGSDIQQIFEELSRAFGVRGFNDIFDEMYKQAGGEFRRHGSVERGRVYRFRGTWPPAGERQRDSALMGGLAKKMLYKLTGIQLPVRGKDIHDTISLSADAARQGGPYAYHLRAKDKKLVVNIPPGIKDRQTIRLAGMGYDGLGGAQPGDLMLKVTIRLPLGDRIKRYWTRFKGAT